MTTTAIELPYGWELDKIITDPIIGVYDPEGQPFPLPENNLYCIMRPMYRDEMWEYVQIQVPKKLKNSAIAEFIRSELTRRR